MYGGTAGGGKRRGSERRTTGVHFVLGLHGARWHFSEDKTLDRKNHNFGKRDGGGAGVACREYKIWNTLF